MYNFCGLYNNLLKTNNVLIIFNNHNNHSISANKKRINFKRKKEYLTIKNKIKCALAENI